MTAGVPLAPSMGLGPSAVSVQSVAVASAPVRAVVDDLDQRQLRRQGGVGDRAGDVATARDRHRRAVDRPARAGPVPGLEPGRAVLAEVVVAREDLDRVDASRGGRVAVAGDGVLPVDAVGRRCERPVGGHVAGAGGVAVDDLDQGQRRGVVVVGDGAGDVVTEADRDLVAPGDVGAGAVPVGGGVAAGGDGGAGGLREVVVPDHDGYVGDGRVAGGAGDRRGLPGRSVGGEGPVGGDVGAAVVVDDLLHQGQPGLRPRCW